MMNKLQKLFASKSKGEKLLSIFLTAGYPELDSLPSMVQTVVDSGADFVEIGVPFSDPIADGPVIQQSSFCALENGMTPELLFEQIYRIRKNSQIPIVLMSYFNPILRFGLDKFCSFCNAVRVDGLIIPDLLPEDSGALQDQLKGHEFGLNFLLSPNASKTRQQLVVKSTHSFVYCVSITGTTGSRVRDHQQLQNLLKSVRQVDAKIPLMTGFGISTSSEASEIGRWCDGVIVGSAVIERFQNSSSKVKAYNAANKLIREIKDGLTGVSNGY